MPIVKVTFAKGPSNEQKSQLIRDITTVIIDRLGVPEASVNVLLTEVEPVDWGIGGIGLDTILSGHVSGDDH